MRNQSTSEIATPVAWLRQTLEVEFEVLSILGVGETSTVFLVRRPGSAREMALKACNEQLSPSVEAFEQEIQQLAKLSHPRVQTLLDAGTVGSVAYYSMPYFASRTLRDVLAQSGVTTDAKMALLRDICEGLAYVHSMGLVHNDLHPANIVVAGGRAIVGDFGDACAIESVRRTTPLRVVGVQSARFQSPERLAANAEVDQRSDIYAVGRIACEMFLSHGHDAPFVAASHAIVPADVPRAAGSRPFRERLATLIRSLVAEDLNARPASIAEVLLSLDALPRDKTRRRSFPRRQTVAVVGGIAIVVAVAIASWRIFKPTSPIKATETPAVAILPFEDLTRGARYGWLATGLTHELIDELTLAPGLRVSAFEIGKSAKDAGAPMSSLRERLGLQIVATGVLEQIGAQLRLTVRLNDLGDPAASGERFEVSADSSDLDLLRGAVTGEIAAKFRQALGARLTPSRNVDSKISTSVWSDFQRAEALQRVAAQNLAAGRGRMADQAMTTADSLYRSALTGDRRWNAPRVALGWLYETRARYIVDTTSNQCLQLCLNWRGRALALADSALAIDAESIDALELRGSVSFELSFAPAKREMAQSLYGDASVDLGDVVKRDPQRARAWVTISIMRSRRGDAAAALTAIENAERADPWLAVGPEVQERAIVNYLMLDENSQAAQRCRRGREAYPERASFQQCALSILGNVGRGKLAIDSAWSELRWTTLQAGDSTSDVTWWFRRAMVAAVLARSGLRDSAYRVLKESRTHRPTDDPNLHYQEAFVYGVAGDTDRVLTSLEQYLKARPTGLDLVMRDRWFAKYRVTAGFRQLKDSLPAQEPLLATPRNP